MAEYKNQHYVPVFLLKYFDNGDGKTTNLWLLQSNKYVKNAAIKDQASEDYFYGNDKTVEHLLGDLETIFSQLVNIIITTRVLPSKGTFEHFLLNLFVVSSLSRTRHSGDVVNEQIDKMIKAVYKHDPKFNDKLDNVKIGIKNPASFSLSIAMENVKYIADLEYKLIENETDKEFIISDNPVVKYNIFLMSRNWPYGQGGMIAKGIQYFFPLGPRFYITLYDQNCYKLGNRHDKVIILKNIQDVNALNEMQTVNANEVIYFSKNVNLSHIQSTVGGVKNNRKKEKVKVKEYIKAGSTKEKGSALVVASALNLNYDLNLSFVKNTKKSKRAILDGRAVQIRSKKLEDMLKKDRERDKDMSDPNISTGSEETYILRG